MHDVFISYKAEEFDDANWVKTTLETNGIRCWMAPMSIPGGSNYALEIPQAIRAAKVFVLILSERSQLSTWVPKELDQAINEGKTIMPFMLENCRLKDDFNFYLSNVQRYAAYANKSAAIEKMIREIRAILGTSESAPAPEAESAPAVVPEPAPAAVSEPPRPRKKPRAEKKTAPKAQKQPSGKKSCPWRVLAIVLAALVVIAGSFIALNKLRTVVIAGTKYKTSESYISIKNARLNAQDIDRLRRFKSLSSLSLTDCELPASGVSGIVGTVRNRLQLCGCGVTDAALAGADFSSATILALNLDDNPAVTDLRALAPLAGKLQELTFDRCGVTDLSFLQDFSSLTKLSCAGNGVTSLEALSACPKLQKLDVSGNALRDLAGLESCIYLNTVLASGNGIESLDGLKNTTLLSEVRLAGNRIGDVSLLAKSQDKLRLLDLSSNSLTDLDALAGCTLVREFSCAENGLKSVGFLAGWTELEKLDAHGNAVADVSSLSGCGKLYSVDLSDNRISDVSALRLVPDKYSTRVDLSGNLIRTLTLPAVYYGTLDVCGNPIEDLSALEGADGGKLVFDYNAGIDFDSLAKSGFSSLCVLDCPLDTQVALSGLFGSYRVEFMTQQEYTASEKGN